MKNGIKYGVISLWLITVLGYLGEGDLQAQHNKAFSHLSVNDGLSQSTIYAITQDSKGFLWFGTRGGGLNRYDGYEFQVYRNVPDVPGSLSDKEVISICEDSYGLLWIGTRYGGINRYDWASGKFKHYLEGMENSPNNIGTAHAIRTIYEDNKGRLWVGTNHRIYLYNREKDEFQRMLHEVSVPIRSVTGICEDSHGNIYFASWDRLIKYNPETDFVEDLVFQEKEYHDAEGTITPIHMAQNDRLWIGTPEGLKMVKVSPFLEFIDENPELSERFESLSYVRIITETRDGIIWLGTEQGLYKYDPATNEFEEYKTDPFNPGSLVHNSIYSIFEDMVGTLWVGTWSGISILDKRKYEFTHFTHLHNDPGSLSSNMVTSFEEGIDGMWIGTGQGGLNFLNKDRTTFRAYKAEENNHNSLPSNNVKSIYRDSDQNLWIGTFEGGLSLLDRNSDSFTNFLENRSVYDIEELPEGKLWIGSISGLGIINLNKRIITEEDIKPFLESEIGNRFVTKLFADSRNRMWIGTKNVGLYLYESVSGTLKHFRYLEDDSTSISSNYIISICEDNDQNIWIGTNNGLNLYNETDEKFKLYGRNAGIEDNVINGLLADSESNIWITTNQGIYQLNYNSDSVSHYDYLDGLQSNEFIRSSYFKDSRGQMFFGGVGGFNMLQPNDILRNPDAPPVIITDLKLFNESVIPGAKDSPLKKHISETKHITLTHRQSSFSFDFVALNYLIPEKNNYAYRLEGYEDDWNQAGRNRTVAYMNLSPGNYTFHVKGSNNNNVWNEKGATIQIEIKGPIWKSPTAIVLYFILLIGLLISLIRIVRFRAVKENELRMERAEKDSLRELHNMKLQFFTNISHEFRTPLTLITGPLDKLMSGRHEHHKEYLFNLMKSNVGRMLRLVNQLMDFRKVESEKMPLKIGKGNLDELVGQIVFGFEDLASRKMIELLYEADSSDFKGPGQWFDEGIIDKVVYNLLSNAFKFTPEQGTIHVRVTMKDDRAEININDTGKGIPPDEVARIFERFYSESKEFYSGTGIGLSLSKRLIDLHKGDIKVKSEPGKGSTFIVSLPVGKENYSDGDIISDSNPDNYNRPGLEQIMDTVTLGEMSGNANAETSFHRLLIAEDNTELSEYLAEHFRQYNPVVADNGRVAFENILENMPDIVISDIMMPEMDGLELCKRIKGNYITSHIPVILLTAKTAIEQKIVGMELGADAYIEKPFDSDYLTAVVRNLLEQRKNLREKYSIQVGSILDNTDVEGADKIFFEKVEEIVQSNISDPEFSVDQLIVMVNMSRSQLYRKFKATTDKNPSEYIRILRLKHAANLILKKEFTISEIAFMSGFGNVSYFITCFKKHFGTPPGKFIDSSGPQN